MGSPSAFVRRLTPLAICFLVLSSSLIPIITKAPLASSATIPRPSTGENRYANPQSTVAGDPAANLTYEIPITLQNSQNSPTPVPFQQMIQINSSKYGSLEASNLQNIEFILANGTVIPSWLESGNNASSASIYWLRLTDSIPAGTNETIYMGIAPETTNLFDGVTVGESPLLSPTYGEYDNGANVFNIYDNFAGTQINTNLWNSGVSGDNTTLDQVSVNNGLNVTVSNKGSSQGTGWAGVVAKVAIPTAQSTFEVSVTGVGGGLNCCSGYHENPYFALGETPAPSLSSSGYFATSYYWYQISQCGQQICTQGPYYFGIGSGNITDGLDVGSCCRLGTGFAVISSGVWGFRWVNSTHIEINRNQYLLSSSSDYKYVNVSSYFSYSHSLISTPSLSYPSLGIAQGLSAQVNVQWIRVRTAAPNETMPKATVESSLTVSSLAGGSVSVQSSALNLGMTFAIDQGRNQTLVVPSGTIVSLTANPYPNYTFAGWNGKAALSPSPWNNMNLPTTTVAVNGADRINATFGTPQTEYSQYWAGYIAAPRGSNSATLVNASWTVQQASTFGLSGQWVGIGGYNPAIDLIQVGTESNNWGVFTNYYAWYETLDCGALFNYCPQTSLGSSYPVKAGDSVSAQVYLLDPSQSVWNVKISDLTQSWQFSKSLTYSSSESTAEWVDEGTCEGVSANQNCYGLNSLPNFGTAQFRSAIAKIDGQTQPIIRLDYHPLFMTSNGIANGQRLAHPSLLSPDGTSFVVTYTGGSLPPNPSSPFTCGCITSQAVASTSVISGVGYLDETSITGLRLDVSGTTVANNTQLTFVSTVLNQQLNGTGQLNVNPQALLDALVLGLPNGLGNLTLSNSAVTAAMVIEYWNGSSWIRSSNLLATAGTISGTIPIDLLSGTPIVVGTPIVTSPGQGGGGGGHVRYT